MSHTPTPNEAIPVKAVLTGEQGACALDLLRDAYKLLAPMPTTGSDDIARWVDRCERFWLSR